MIYKMLSVCNKHISKETRDWLNEQCLVNAMSHDTREMASIHAGSHGYGWFVYCHDDGLEDYPKDLVAIMEFAQKHDCWYINLDADGQDHNELEVFEW